MTNPLDWFRAAFFIFMMAIGIAILFTGFLLGTALVKEILKLIPEVLLFIPISLALVFSDPWALLAFPIVAGAMILYFQNLWLSNDEPPVLRGRQIGTSRGEQNQSRSAKTNRKTPNDRATSPRTKPPERPKR